MIRLPFFTRRFIETIFIMLASSLPIYLIAKSGFIPSNLLFYIILFTASAVIFLALSTAALRTYLVAVDDVKIYFLTNGILLIMQGLFCIAGLKWFSGDLYTALFGYTKALRAFGVGNVKAAAIFWFVHFIQIVIIPVIRAKVQKEIAEMVQMEEKEQNSTNL